MTSADCVEQSACELTDQARAVLEAAARAGSSAAAGRVLASSEEALRILSAGWSRLAADAAASVAEGRLALVAADPPADDVISREQEVSLVAALQDVAAGLAKCARECRQARSTVGPLLEGRAQLDDGLVHSGAR